MSVVNEIPANQTSQRCEPCDFPLSIVAKEHVGLDVRYTLECPRCGSRTIQFNDGQPRDITAMMSR